MRISICILALLCAANVPAQSTRPHWAFVPVAREVTQRGAHPIDHFSARELKKAGLAMSPPADRATLIRRLTFDLIGLPPTPAEIDAFVADQSEDAYDKLVDRLLASPHFGERWARHWLDAVRFAESDGFETNPARPNAWPYRDYVIKSFNADKPYDQFVREQIAGDQLGADEATAFLVGGPVDQVKSPDPVLTAQQRADELHDMIATTGSTFLGLTVGCARCHNHKFDPIPQVDYHRFKGVFSGVQHGERPMRPADHEARNAEAKRLRERLAPIEKELSEFVPMARAGRTILIDDEDAARLIAPGGQAAHEKGTARGEAEDGGEISRLPNLGKSYAYWHAKPDTDVIAYAPKAAGSFDVWLSWGCGFAVHAKDAAYVLDRDGDLATREDQSIIATVDQRKFADGSGDMPNRKLWSGFAHAGTHELTAASRIVLRSGATNAPVSADVILLQEGGSLHLRSAVTSRANVERIAPVEARFVRMTIDATTQFEPCIDELEVFASDGRNIALGAKPTSSGDYAGNPIHQLVHINDGKFGNDWSWISNTAGKGQVILELARAEAIERIVWSRDRATPPKYNDRTATAYRIEVSRDGENWTSVASSADRVPYAYRHKPAAIMTMSGATPEQAARFGELSKAHGEIEAKIAALTAFANVYAGRFTVAEANPRLFRGDVTQPREAIAPGALSKIGAALDLPADAPEHERRIALARWITDPANPLPARVIVNRLWHHHFGTGIVDTPSDFGRMGGRPSHPELLDWLASELVANGWRLKHIHRLIVTSAVYRQSSALRGEAFAADAGSRLLWRYPPRRLEAESLRDAILAVSGKLDGTMHGPGFDLFEPNTNYVKVYNARKSFTPETFRRMIYQAKPRMQLDDTFGAFDCPDAGQIAPRRNSSITPLQALNLLNSAFVIEQSEFFAERIKSERDPVGAAFRLAFGRAPGDPERAAASQLIERHGLATFCRALFNANEFVSIR